MGKLCLLKNTFRNLHIFCIQTSDWRDPFLMTDKELGLTDVEALENMPVSKFSDERQRSSFPQCGKGQNFLSNDIYSVKTIYTMIDLISQKLL